LQKWYVCVVLVLQVSNRSKWKMRVNVVRTNVGGRVSQWYCELINTRINVYMHARRGVKGEGEGRGHTRRVREGSRQPVPGPGPGSCNGVCRADVRGARRSRSAAATTTTAAPATPAANRSRCGASGRDVLRAADRVRPRRVGAVVEREVDTDPDAACCEEHENDADDP